MKKAVLAICLAMVITSLGACAKTKKIGTPPAGQSAPATTADSEGTEVKETDGTETEETDSETDAHNRAIVAEAMEISENEPGLRYMLSALNTIHAGKIQSAVYYTIYPDRVLDIVAEDGTAFRIYVSGNASVWAVHNLDTDEWPLASIM